MNVLVDTSVWSLALRRKTSDLNESEKSTVVGLTELIQAGRVRIIGLIRQELLSGIRTPSQFEKLRNVLRAFPDELIDISDHEFAAKASNECRQKGIAVSIVDALICAIALVRDWPIFTIDPDFREYAKVLSIKLYVPHT